MLQADSSLYKEAEMFDVAQGWWRSTEKMFQKAKQDKTNLFVLKKTKYIR